MYRVIYEWIAKKPLSNAEPKILGWEGTDYSFSQIVICLQPKTQT
jgi:hypothetical protein